MKSFHCFGANRINLISLRGVLWSPSEWISDHWRIWNNFHNYSTPPACSVLHNNSFITTNESYQHRCCGVECSDLQGAPISGTSNQLLFCQSFVENLYWILQSCKFKCWTVLLESTSQLKQQTFLVLLCIAVQIFTARNRVCKQSIA